MPLGSLSFKFALVRLVLFVAAFNSDSSLCSLACSAEGSCIWLQLVNGSCKEIGLVSAQNPP